MLFPGFCNLTLGGPNTCVITSSSLRLEYGCLPHSNISHIITPNDQILPSIVA